MVLSSESSTHKTTQVMGSAMKLNESAEYQYSTHVGKRCDTNDVDISYLAESQRHISFVLIAQLAGADNVGTKTA